MFSEMAEEWVEEKEKELREEFRKSSEEEEIKIRSMVLQLQVAKHKAQGAVDFLSVEVNRICRELIELTEKKGTKQ